MKIKPNKSNLDNLPQTLKTLILSFYLDLDDPGYREAFSLGYFTYLNVVSDLIGRIVSTQDVDSVSGPHCSCIEPCALK